MDSFETDTSQSVPDSLPDFASKQMVAPEIPYFETEPELEPLPILEMEKPQKHLVAGPIFVRTDKYSQILSNLDNMAAKVLESPETIYMLKNLKKNADIEHSNYIKLLEDIQRKLIYIDNVLFESMRE
ncbi:MAG: hypothetical protein NDI94_03730 [Candidatus Woesearchaeota archaeon]|nr:hypothetical protein [Candidatus Woesearchaeota archaeon]